MAFSIILIVVLIIAAIVAAYVLLLPERRSSYLSPFWTRVRDFLTMKHLYLEKVLRTLYIISTIFTFVICIAGGLLSPFIMPGNRNFGSVLLGMVLGLLVGAILAAVLLFIIRISYESIMLRVTLTDAAKKINQKLNGDNERRSYEEPRRRIPAPAPRPAICRRCGARFDPRRGYCPNCDERW